MTKEGFEVYKLYLALQRHFSTDYDFFKYHGKVRATTDSYSKRNDLYSFEKLTKIVLPEDRIDFFVAHFLENPKCWIRNMSKAKMEQYHARIKNFPTIFSDELQKIALIGPGTCIKVQNDIPEIHKMVLNDSITIETVIAIDKFYPFIDKHANEVKISFLWPDYIQKLTIVGNKPIISTII